MNQNQISILKRIVNNPYPQLRGCIIDNLGRYCFCDAYRIVKLNESPPELFHNSPSFSLLRNDSLDRLWYQYVCDKDGQRVYPVAADVRECARKKVLYPTRVPLFRYLSKSVKTGNVYNNIRTAWKHTVKRDGKEEQMECEINFIVRSYGKFGKKSLYDIVNVIYGDKDSVLLYIQRRESERNGKKNVTWTPLISFTDDNNVTYTCQLSPSTDGDNAMWNLLLSILNKNGVINGYSPI